MPLVYILGLRSEDRAALQLVVDRGENWRCRERARTLLLLDDGISTRAAANALGLNRRTIQTTRSGWFQEGLASLQDLPRIGAPKKITVDQLTKIVEAATDRPLSAKQLLEVHVEAGGTPVALGTLTKALKAAGLVWKRTRHSLKKTV